MIESKHMTRAVQFMYVFGNGSYHSRPAHIGASQNDTVSEKICTYHSRIEEIMSSNLEKLVDPKTGDVRLVPRV